MGDADPVAGLREAALAPGAERDASSSKVEIYSAFCGPIEQQILVRIMRHLVDATAMVETVSGIHILFQSGGGTVGDCVCLYNLLRSFPMDVTLYNGGAIQSGAVTAYLGAKRRRTSAHAQFMLHPSHCSAEFAGRRRLESTLDAMRGDEARTETIVRTHTQLPEALWAQVQEREIFFSGADAVRYGIADEIAEFAPPPGTRIHWL